MILSMKKRKPKPKPAHAPGAGPDSHVAPGGGHYEEGEHPRGPGGRFADKPGEEKPKPKPSGGAEESKPKKPPKRGRQITSGKPEPSKSALGRQMLDDIADDNSYRPGGEAHYNTIRKSGADWVEGKSQPEAINQAWGAVYKETQDRLASQGIKGIVCYRGVRVPKDHPLAESVKAGKLKAGDFVEASGLTFTSWSGKAGIAKKFVEAKGGNDDIGFVMQRKVPARDIVASHLTHDSLKANEAEHLVKNTDKATVRIMAIKKSRRQAENDRMESQLRR